MTCPVATLGVAPRHDGEISRRGWYRGVVCRGAYAALLTCRPDLSWAGGGWVAIARCGPSQIMDRPAIKAALNNNRRSPGPSRPHALGNRGAWASDRPSACRIPEGAGERPRRRLLVASRGGYADAAGATTDMAPAQNMGFAGLSHGITSRAHHRPHFGCWDALVDIRARHRSGSGRPTLVAALIATIFR
jgi:hypothetical protein